MFVFKANRRQCNMLRFQRLADVESIRYTNSVQIFIKGIGIFIILCPILLPKIKHQQLRLMYNVTYYLFLETFLLIRLNDKSVQNDVFC